MTMKKKYLISLACCCFLMLMRCVAQREVETVPLIDSTGLTREQLIAHIEKGQLLFKKKCASCHGIFTKGKDSIPNFSKVELASYKIRFIQGDPLNHAVSQKMTDDEFEDVIYFLQNYKRPEPGKEGTK